MKGNVGPQGLLGRRERWTGSQDAWGLISSPLLASWESVTPSACLSFPALLTPFLGELWDDTGEEIKHFVLLREQSLARGGAPRACYLSLPLGSRGIWAARRLARLAKGKRRLGVDLQLPTSAPCLGWSCQGRGRGWVLACC